MSDNETFSAADELAYEVRARQANAPLSDYLIAVLAHEINRTYCAMIGDYSQLPWIESPQWQRVSALKGVAFIRAFPESSPELSHDEWLKEKEVDGWSYGPVKDDEAKTHPCCVAYEDLPADQRRKDAIFQGVVRGALV